MASERRETVPELFGPGALYLGCDWQVYDEVYPTQLVVTHEVTTHPDPFSPESGERECYHCYVDIEGLARVDLGWTIRGEPYTYPPVVSVTLDTTWVSRLRDGFGGQTRPDWVRGEGTPAARWAGLLDLSTVTAVGVALHYCERAVRHPAFGSLLQFAAEASRFQSGMLRRWPIVSLLDLGTLRFE